MSCASPRRMVCLKEIVAPLRTHQFGGDDDFIIEDRRAQKSHFHIHHRELTLRSIRRRS